MLCSFGLLGTTKIEVLADSIHLENNVMGRCMEGFAFLQRQPITFEALKATQYLNIIDQPNGPLLWSHCICSTKVCRWLSDLDLDDHVVLFPLLEIEKDQFL